MIGNAAHGSFFLLSGISGRQGDFQFPGCQQGILEEHFIEITKTKEQYAILILFFDFFVLFHHW